MEAIFQEKSFQPQTGWVIWHQGKPVKVFEETILQIRAEPMKSLGWCDDEMGRAWKKNLSDHSFLYQNRVSSTRPSCMGSDPQPLVEFHHRHTDVVLGGDRGIEQAKKTICVAPLRRIQVDNSGKEVGGFQGNDNSPNGESPNAKACADSSPSEDMRYANLLQVGNRRNPEVYDGLETEMEEFQGSIEKAKMEYGGSSHNES